MEPENCGVCKQPTKDCECTCADCGAPILGGHGACNGVPGGFGDEDGDITPPSGTAP